MMYTFQDYEKAKNEGREIQFIQKAIEDYRVSNEYKIALSADEYEAERNETILKFMRMIYTFNGIKVPDFTAGDLKIASNFFHTMTTQRVAYSLGNGISFPGATSEVVDGKARTVDPIKEKLGEKFDTVLYKAGKKARIHGVSYLMWNLDHADLFKMTEYMPLFDEDMGIMRAGFRFWSLDWNKRPVTVVVYEEDGYTKYRTKRGSTGLDLVINTEKQGYIKNVAHTAADGDQLLSYSNYSSLPIVPFYGCENKQSDLVGMRAKIDTYDLIKSGFANDVNECPEIYWLISNAEGMKDEDLIKFRDRIKLNHIAVADQINSNVEAHTHEIPVAARESILKSVREQLYEDYGALDVHTVAAGATNDHIDMAYQRMDDEADDFEYQVIEAVQGILALIGEKSVPIFKRNKISNQKEQTEMVALVGDDLDLETRLKKYPFLTPDEVQEVKARKLEEDASTVDMEE